VAGDSAGGGLTAALLVATRDAGEALPAAAALMSPTVDLTSSGASMTERPDQDPISGRHAPSVRPPTTWPERQPTPGSTSPCKSERACPTSTSSCSAPPRQPRPPTRSGSSCEPRFANQAAHRRRVSRRPVRPFALEESSSPLMRPQPGPATALA
jgi:acetyl esterase/lipase